jgi:murein DD-endopeptidase MepM/ murein hydrolase activator NlpD
MKKIIIATFFIFNFYLIFSQDNNITKLYYENIENLLELYSNAKKEFNSNNNYRMDVKYSIPFNFGFRKNPFTGQIHFYDHITILVFLSDVKVFSITEGKVIEIGYKWEYGSYIKIKYKNFEIDYGNIIDIKVEVGDIINKNQIIGFVGSCLGTIGPGIHLRIKYKDIPLNPEIILIFDDNRVVRKLQFLNNFI